MLEHLRADEAVELTLIDRGVEGVAEGELGLGHGLASDLDRTRAEVHARVAPDVPPLEQVFRELARSTADLEYPLSSRCANAVDHHAPDRVVARGVVGGGVEVPILGVVGVVPARHPLLSAHPAPCPESADDLSAYH